MRCERSCAATSLTSSKPHCVTGGTGARCTGAAVFFLETASAVAAAVPRRGGYRAEEDEQVCDALALARGGGGGSGGGCCCCCCCCCWCLGAASVRLREARAQTSASAWFSMGSTQSAASVRQRVASTALYGEVMTSSSAEG